MKNLNSEEAQLYTELTYLIIDMQDRFPDWYDRIQKAMDELNLDQPEPRYSAGLMLVPLRADL